MIANLANLAALVIDSVKNGSIGGFVYLFKDEFTTADAAPLNDPRTAEPGPGAWRKEIDTNNKISISGNALVHTADPGVEDPSYLTTTAISRAAGVVLKLHLNYTTNTWHFFGFTNSSNPVSQFSSVTENSYFLTGSSLSIRELDSIIVKTLSTSTNYDIYVVLRGTGAFYFVDEELVMVSGEGSTATLYSGFSDRNTAATNNYWRITTLSSPFTTDNGIRDLNITSFSQSVGSEQITNGNFSSWTSDNPDNWTVVGESGGDPEVTERDPSQGHADTKTTGGAANIYQSGTGLLRLRKTNFFNTEGFYEIKYTVTNRVSGTLNISEPFGVIQSTALTGAHRKIVNINQTGGSKEFDMYISGAAADLTVDDVSVKEITVNSKQTTTANVLAILSFSLPGSPQIGSELHLYYREQDTDNFWDAYLSYDGSQWNFKLDSYVANIRTNRISVSAVGTPDTLVIKASGNNHDCYTVASGTYTKRGSTISNSSLNSATGIRPIYTTDFTDPTSLQTFPTTSSTYSVLTTI